MSGNPAISKPTLPFRGTRGGRFQMGLVLNGRGAYIWAMSGYAETSAGVTHCWDDGPGKDMEIG